MKYIYILAISLFISINLSKAGEYNLFEKKYNWETPDESGDDWSSINIDSKTRINLQIGFNLVGGGKVEFGHDVVEQAPGNDNSGIVNRTFLANLTTSQTLLSASYSYKSWGLGITYFREKIKYSDETTIYLSSNGRIFEQRESNWPLTRQGFGPFIEYDLQIGKNTFFSPRYQFYTYRYTSDRAFLDSSAFSNNNLKSNEVFVARQSHAISSRLKFGLGVNSLIYFETSYIINKFSVGDDYFTEVTTNEYSKSYQINIGIGVQFSFMQRK